MLRGILTILAIGITLFMLWAVTPIFALLSNAMNSTYNPQAITWVSPTEHNDTESHWSNEAQAYDGSTGTWATNTALYPVWGSFLELTIDEIPCSKIRFYEHYWGDDYGDYDVDLYWSGSWHNVHDGAVTMDDWTVVNLGGVKQVTKAKVRIYHNTIGFTGLAEFAFGQAGKSTSPLEGALWKGMPIIIAIVAIGCIIYYVYHKRMES